MTDRTEPGPAGQAHYFHPDPTTPSEPVVARLLLPDVTFDLTTDRGVFARGRIDAGTKLLLLDGPEQVPDDRNLFDLGAGYGPVALTLAARNPEATVWAIEINERARELCRANASRAGLANIEVVSPDEVPEGLVVDRIWSNPPIRIGKAALHTLLGRWLPHLGPDGSAHLVVQKHLGSDSLQRWLESAGWPTSRRCSRAGYRLLDIEARSTDPVVSTEADR